MLFADLNPLAKNANSIIAIILIALMLVILSYRLFIFICSLFYSLSIHINMQSVEFKNIVLFFTLLLLFFAASKADASAWKLAKNFWTEEDEKLYEHFVESLCDSKYSNLNKFIRDPKANPLYGEDDKTFDLKPDCADLPYLVRAYVAYKLRLPFNFTSAIRGKGGDQRYSKENRPTAFKNQSQYKSAQSLFYNVLLINSGYFRIPADSDLSDHYPVKITKKSIVPGTIYYDPNGHVALVGKVAENGRIRMIDAHPDKTISKPWFGTKFNKGSKDNGGGFKRWRPIRALSDDQIVTTKNHNIYDYSNTDQYKKSYAVKGRKNLNYHEYVRESLSDNRKSDPLKEFAFMMQELYEDIVYRSVAVELAVKRGISKMPHPGALPYNIYGTDGIWEEYSTPSRDARLKVAFQEFYYNTQVIISNIAKTNYEQARKVAWAMVAQYDDLSSHYAIYYQNSLGKQVLLSFDEVLKRLFALSFDPYHSVELRWGARGEELQSARDDETKLRFYNLEQRLRNNTERVYGRSTPLSFGPDAPPEVNIRNWLVAFVKGEALPVEPAVQQVVVQRANSAPIEPAVVSLPAKQGAEPGFIPMQAPEPVVAPVQLELPGSELPETKTLVASFEKQESWISAIEELARAIRDVSNYSRE